MQRDLPFDYGLGEQMLLFLAIGIGMLLLCAIAFAASVVVLRFQHDRRDARWRDLEARWEAAIFDVIAGDAEPEALWNLVADDEQLYCVDYILRFARRVTGEERRRLATLAQPFLPPIAERVQARDPQRRARAVQTLGELGLARYVNEVIVALDDPSPLVAMVAARALAREEHAGYLEPVLSHLHRFTNWSPNFLASMLSFVGPSAAPALRSELADARRLPEVRAVVATALTNLNDYDAANVAAPILEEETNRELVTAVLRLLSRIGREEQLPLVRKAAQSTDFVIRAAAATALGSLGQAQDMQVLREACEDDSKWVALHAARALRDAGEVESLYELAESERARATLALQVLSEKGV
jgi:HEAT repeat protein